MEGKGNRINQEHRLLHLPLKCLENPPGMEGKCMRCGRPEHQQGEKCAAKNVNAKTTTRLDTSTRYVSRARGQEEPI